MISRYTAYMSLFAVVLLRHIGLEGIYVADFHGL